MSRHRMYRNYDYEDDMADYDGVYYEDDGEDADTYHDGLQGGYDSEPAEDLAILESATTAVRTGLGSDAGKVTTAQIHESLYHYDGDVDKTIAYLTKTYIKPPPPKAKAAKKKPEASNGNGNGVSFADFFNDMPWLNVSKERCAVFTRPVHIGCGGLLGGSLAVGKMSKLQQLALARKKKAEEQKAITANEPVQELILSNGEPHHEQLQQSQLHHCLAMRAKERDKDNIQPSLSVPDAVAKPAETVASTSENSVPASASAPAIDTASEGASPTLTLDSIPTPSSVMAEPSDFAQVLCGSAIEKQASQLTEKRIYPLPWVAMLPFPWEELVRRFSEPSPDDIVLAAQAKASNKKLATTAARSKSTTATDANNKSNQMADGVLNLSVNDTPLPKSKNLDVLGEYERSEKKKTASFVVVGHVDAGKSTMMGRLLLDLGHVDQRTIVRYRKEAQTLGKSSFALAWVLDQRSEERSRGVTIDIATNKFDTDTTTFTILDAPGHRDYIPNMIAGASQADFAILVIDASTGAFEAGLKGQTREHALLIRSMGVSRVIIAINKLDAVDWSQDRYQEIVQQVSGFLSGTGFQSKNTAFVPLSGLNGDNIVNPSSNPAAAWYKGQTLIQELEASEPSARAMEKPFRFPISEVFRSNHSPVTVSGRIDAGSIQTGDAILVQPSGEKAFVKSLELDGSPVDWAVAGQNVVLHLSNIDAVHVRVGDIACSAANPIECTDTFTVKALAFDMLVPSQVDVHKGRLHAAGQIVEMVAVLDKSTGAVTKKKPRIVKPGSVARIVVRLGSKLPLEKGGRVVLRSAGETIAAGLLE